MISISKKKFKHAFKTKMYSLYAQPVEEASKDEIFRVLCCVIKDFIAKEWVGTRIDKEKAVFYFSMEFLIGRQLESNLLNLDVEHEIEQGLKELATCIQNSLNQTIQKQNDRVPLKIDNVYIIKHVEIPISIVECGFLSNPEEMIIKQN